MTSITMHGGVGEIGGNKMLLKDRDSRVFLDFGLSYSRKGQFFEEFLTPRTANGMGDLVKTGLLPDPRHPDFAGVYRSDYLRMAGYSAPSHPSIEGVLLSHIHMDHSSYISFLHEDVPVYASQASVAMAEALDLCTQTNFENEVWDFKLRPSKRNDQYIRRKWVELKPFQRTNVGDIEVTGLPVDHSVPGAMSYLIHTSEGTVLYTGDLRVEGYGSNTASSLPALRAEHVDLMLCEGTRINESDMKTEEHIRSFATTLSRKFKGMVVAGFAFKDVQRLQTFLEVARTTERTMVITPKDAVVLEHLRRKGMPDLPDPEKDPSIEVLVEPKRTGTFDDADYAEWERKYLGWGNRVLSRDLSKGGSRRIVHAGFFDMTTFIDFEMPPQSVYIHSLSEAHNEEQAIDDQRLNKWLEVFGLRRFNLHASGHACCGELMKLVEAADPERIVPMHTEHPEMFAVLHHTIESVGLQGTVQVKV